MKKLFAVYCLLFTVFLSGCLPKKTNPEPPPGTSPVPTKPLEEAILEKPFISLVPTTDGHWVNMEVKNIKAGTKSVDYELIYFAGDVGNKIERGVAGSIEINNQTSFERKILFGSESCTSGRCKYKFDENVSEGMLSLKLKSDGGTEKFESAFRLQKGSEGSQGFGIGDGGFKFTTGSLPKNSYFLTISTLGLPQVIAQKAVSIPYAVFPSASAKGEISFKTSDPTAKILFWDSGKWQELTVSQSDGWLVASVSKTGVFLLVK